MPITNTGTARPAAPTAGTVLAYAPAGGRGHGPPHGPPAPGTRVVLSPTGQPTSVGHRRTQQHPRRATGSQPRPPPGTDNKGLGPPSRAADLPQQAHGGGQA